MVNSFTPEQQALACRALLARAEGKGPTLPGVVVGAARSICDCEDLDQARLRKLAGLQDLFRDDPDVRPYLGIERSALSRSSALRLEAFDLEGRASVLAITDKTLVDTAEAIDIEIRSRVDRAKLTTVEQLAFDDMPFRAFLHEKLRPQARAALTVDEETLALAAIERSAVQAIRVLERTADAALEELEPTMFLDNIITGFERDRPRAVAAFTTSMTSMILGRLEKATDNEERVLLDAVTPEGVARDLLEIAGGSAATDLGGIPRQNGRPLTPAGEVSKGANLAQGHTVSAEIEDQLLLTPLAKFRHSGKKDGRSKHKAANGLYHTDITNGAFPGEHPDCGCGWTIEYLETA